jgi:hypothetical protein
LFTSLLVYLFTMALITPTEVVSIAYITEIDPSMVKPEFITTAEKKFIKPVLSTPLYNDVINNTINYQLLIINYIKPCLAFYVKYTMMNQQLLETSQYTPGTDPSLSPVLVEITTAVMLPRDHRRDAILEVLKIAQHKEALLYEFVITQNYTLYETPSSRRISGFRISLN